VSDLLLYGDTARSANMRRELPISIGDQIGGVRFEDLLLVTDDGSRTLTNHPSELAP
jgi:hypothetical protein